MEVSHSLAKGGDAGGTEADTLPCVLHHRACADDLHGPKSVLAARIAPERLT